MTNLSRKYGDMEFDGLVTDLTPPVQVCAGTIAKLAAAAVYKRGTILAKSAADGMLYILGTDAADNDTLTPDCILCDDVEIGTDANVVVPVYTAGCFSIGKCIVSADYTMTESDKDALRMRGVVFKSASEAE